MHLVLEQGLHPQIKELAYNTNLCEPLFCFIIPFIYSYFIYKSCHINLCVTFHVYVCADQTVYN